MPAFNLVCVGAGGGPDETNLSAYLIKPCGTTWEDGVIALEAGSGQGALQQILRRNPHLFASPGNKEDNPRRYTAAEIYSFVKCYVISHVHLDHISSLVISAGSLSGPRKRVYASKTTLQDLESVFSDRLWPNLASWNEHDEAFKLLYTTLHPDGIYKPIHADVSLRMIPVNHGTNGTGTYESAAFFIRHDPTGSEFLFFGDVEPDAVSRSTPRNIAVWRLAAPKIPAPLSTIFIECSWPSGRPDDLLYGHLSPEHLVAELEVLAGEIVKFRENKEGYVTAAASSDSRGNTLLSRLRPARKKQRMGSVSASSVGAVVSPEQQNLINALEGLSVYVTHCKDTMDCDRPIHEVIVEQVRTLVVKKGLGAKILAAEQGMHIEI